MCKKTIYQRFSHWVKRRPQAIAVTEDGRKATYGELDRMANAIMTKFYAYSLSTVGIVMSHGIEMIAAMLAVLKSGAAYVPAEPSLPKERIDYMMQAAGAGLFVPSHKNCRISRIKDFLRSRLADFMVPEFFVKMDEIPLNRRGKVNDRALPVVMKEGDME